MEIIYLPQADADLAYRVKTGNKTILRKIAELAGTLPENSYEAIEKPEALT